MANADCIVLIGGNMAEAHPVGFQWVAEAKARGARPFLRRYSSVRPMSWAC